MSVSRYLVLPATLAIEGGPHQFYVVLHLMGNVRAVAAPRRVFVRHSFPKLLVPQPHLNVAEAVQVYALLPVNPDRSHHKVCAAATWVPCTTPTLEYEAGLD